MPSEVKLEITVFIRVDSVLVLLKNTVQLFNSAINNTYQCTF